MEVSNLFQLVYDHILKFRLTLFLSVNLDSNSQIFCLPASFPNLLVSYLPENCRDQFDRLSLPRGFFNWRPRSQLRNVICQCYHLQESLFRAIISVSVSVLVHQFICHAVAQNDYSNRFLSDDLEDSC